MNSNKKILKIIIGIAVVVLIFAGFYLFKTEKAPAELNIGLISILSGDYASSGENMKNGVVLAQEIYNESHPKSKVNVFIEDDGFSSRKGVSAYQKLTSLNHIDGLINVSTPTIDAIYDMVVKDGMPVIQGGEQGQEPVADNIFGIYPNSVDSEYEYGVYLRNKGIKEMAVVYTNNDTMIRFVAAFKAGFQGKTTDFVIDGAEKDFRTHALKVTSINPQTLGLFIFPQQGALFVKEFLNISKNKPQIFFDANFQSGFADYKRILGDTKILDDALVGTIDFATTQAFKDDYKKRFGTEPGFLTDVGYDMFNVLVSTYSKDKTKWVENIQNLKTNGASGNIEFGETGNRKPKTKIMVVKEGEIADF